jgi:ribulose-phosphate 3-epimerase
MIIPAVLDNSTQAVREKVNKVKGLVKRVQVDVIDGVFADNLTVTPADLVDVDFRPLAVDFHLMVEDPESYVDECALLRGGSVGVRIVGQIERMGSQEKFITRGHEAGCQMGLAIDLYTPVSSIDQKLFTKLDCVLVMSVKAGFSGQHFVHTISKKIEKLIHSGYDGEIVDDGGEDPKHILLSKAAGATSFAVGSYLWQHEDIKAALQELKEIDRRKRKYG